MASRHSPRDVYIVAVPETAGSALYGLVDVLSAAGNLWQSLLQDGTGRRLLSPRIVSTTSTPFLCGNGIPVQPALAIGDADRADILILPELWLGPEESLKGRYPELMDWIGTLSRRGAFVYSACSGALMLAEAGLLDDREATSHWGYEQLFRRAYPRVRFRPEPNLVFADPAGRVVTAGGTTSWHDLALHIIARHCNPGEALRIAKVYLLKWHDEGQLPFAPGVRPEPHGDAVVRACQNWLEEHFRERHCIARVVAETGIPERSLKRRFRQATGMTLIDYLHNLRVEEAKRLLETTALPVDEVSAGAGYDEPAFFRRLFKRTTGLTPGSYRKLFQPVAMAQTDSVARSVGSPVD